MKKLSYTLLVVVSGLLSWSAYETCNLVVAQRQLAASYELAQNVNKKIAEARIKAADKVASAQSATGQ